jgi:hypothetical protein
MKCISDEIIQKFIDKETSAKENFFVQNHLPTCSKCAKKVEESRYSTNHIKKLIGSLNKNEIQVPLFKEPEKQKRTLSIRFNKVFYAASAACLVIFFLVFQQKPKDEIEFVYSYDVDSEYNANLPLSEQEMVIEIIDSEGNLLKY